MRKISFQQIAYKEVVGEAKQIEAKHRGVRAGGVFVSFHF